MIASAIIVSLSLGASLGAWVSAEPGVQISTPSVVSERGYTATIVPFGDGYIAAWLDLLHEAPRKACIVIRRLSSSGAPLGEPRNVHCGGIGPPTLTSSETHLLAVWGGGGIVSGAVLDRDLVEVGKFTQEFPFFTESIKAAFDGTQFIVAGTWFQRVAVLFVGNNGHFAHPPLLLGPGSFNKASVSCDRDGACLLFTQQSLENTVGGGGRFDVARIERGLRQGQLTAHPGGFEYVGAIDHVVVSAPTATFAFFSSSSGGVWGKKVADGQQVFRFGPSKPLEYYGFTAAAGERGSAVVWQTRLPGGGEGTEIAVILPTNARILPITIPNLFTPAVATLDGQRFVVLGGMGGKLQSQLVTVDLDRLPSPAAPRGNAVEGKVVSPDGKPVQPALAFCSIRLRSGASTEGLTEVGLDGRFSIAHPLSDDARSQADIEHAECWAFTHTSNLVSPMSQAKDGKVMLTLRPVQPLAQVRITALQPNGERRFAGDLHATVTPGRLRVWGPGRLFAGTTLKWDNVVPGESLVRLYDDYGFGVTETVHIAPGVMNTIEVPFWVPLPAGRVGIVLNHALKVSAVAPGSQAEEAGVRIGDRLIAVDGETPANLKDAVEKLAGEPSTTVNVQLERELRQLTLQITRSGPPKPRQIQVKHTPLERDVLERAGKLVPLAPGEVLHAAAPALPVYELKQTQIRLSDPRTALDFPEGVPVANPLRISISLEGQVVDGIPGRFTLTGPGDLLYEQEYRFSNSTTRQIYSFSGVFTETHYTPPRHIDVPPAKLNDAGRYRAKLELQGRTPLEREFMVIPHALEPAYKAHDFQHPFANYKLIARARVQPADSILITSRAVFRRNHKSMTVDVSDESKAEEVDKYFASIAQRAEKTQLQSRLQNKSQTVFRTRNRARLVLSWPSGNRAVAVTADALGPEEQEVLSYYVGRFPSRLAP